ncbi:MAG: epoxyqueuosine reductase [Theionarchaea archaeon]|nr:epoxyqueuosine reductase [Theionarchaea archaeon]
MMQQSGLKEALRREGADLVGITSCKEYFPEYTSALIIGVSALRIYRLKRTDTVQAMNEIMDYLNISARQRLITEGFGTWGPLFSQEEFSRSLNYVPHRELALRAGLGTIGKNFLLITPQFGPRIQLTTVLTTMPLLPDPPVSFDPCRGCTICVDHCPTGALNDIFHQELCTKCYRCVLSCPVGEDFQEIQPYVQTLPGMWTSR